MRRVIGLTLTILILVAASAGCGARQQSSYPTQAIELVAPYAPGGVTDLAARIVAEFVSKEWKQPVNVVNKPGGTAVVGTTYVLQSKPDGYTMLMHSVSAGTLNPAMQSTLPYKWDQPTLICRTNVSPIVFVVKGDSPWKSLSELGEAIKQDPSKFSFATGAAGGPSTFAAGIFLKALGVNVKDVPMAVFDGGALAANAVAGGHVAFAAQNLPEVVGLVKSGHLRALAVTTPERAAQLPDVPTTAEAGFPDITIMGWNGVAGPPGLPDEVVKKWADTLQALSKNEDYAKKMADAGTVVSWLGPEDFKAFIGKEYEAMRTLAEELGLRK